MEVKFKKIYTKDTIVSAPADTIAEPDTSNCTIKPVLTTPDNMESSMSDFVLRPVRESALAGIRLNISRMPIHTRANYLSRFYPGAAPDRITEATVLESYAGGDDRVDLLLNKGLYVEALEKVRVDNEREMVAKFDSYIRHQPTYSPTINLQELDAVSYVPRTKDNGVSLAVTQTLRAMIGHLQGVREFVNVLPQQSLTSRTNLNMDISTRLGALNKLMLDGDIIVTEEIVRMLCGSASHVTPDGKAVGILNMTHGHTCGVSVKDDIGLAFPWKEKTGNISSMEVNRSIHFGSNQVVSKSCLFTRGDMFSQDVMDNKVLLLVASPFSPGLTEFHGRLLDILTEMMQVSADEYNYPKALTDTAAAIADLRDMLDTLVADINVQWYTLKMYHIPHIQNTTSTRMVTVGHEEFSLTIAHNQFEVEDMAIKAKPSTKQYKFISPRTGKTSKTDVLHAIIDDEVVRITRANEQTAALHTNGVYRLTEAGELEFTIPWPDDDDLEHNFIFITFDSATSALKAMMKSREEYNKLKKDLDKQMDTSASMVEKLAELKTQIDELKVQLKDKDMDHQHKQAEIQLKRDAHDLNKYVVETDIVDKRFNQHLALMKLNQASRDIMFKIITKAEAKGGNLVASSVSQIAGMSAGANALIPSLLGPIENYMSILEKQEQIEFFTQLHQVENENIRLLANWLDKRYTGLEEKHAVAIEPSPPPKQVEQPVSHPSPPPRQPPPQTNSSFGGGYSAPPRQRSPAPSPVTKTESWSGKTARIGKAVAASAAVITIGLYLGFGALVVGGAAFVAGALTYI